MLKPRRTLHRHVHLHRELGWLEANAGPYELNAYWTRIIPKRAWHRLEVSRHGFVAGHLTLLAMKRPKEPLAPRPTSPPHLSCIKGGRG
jgi:hypothetical protein